MARNSFAQIRKALANHDRQALISLVGELYAVGAANRDFLEARFVSRDAALDRYKRIISDALFPDVMSSKPVRFRDAKKAIADYTKAAGDLRGIAELSVFAAECGTAFTCNYGDIDEPFYSALIRVFDSAVKAILALKPEEAEPFIDRLGSVVTKASEIGWGYHDTISDQFERTFCTSGDDE